MRRSRE